jgi:hypothetical protein
MTVDQEVKSPKLKFILDVSKFGGESVNIKSVFTDPKDYGKTIKLPAPTLNITPFYDGHSWNKELGSWTFTLADGSLNYTLSKEYLMDNGSCNPDNAGFSALLLFFAILFTVIWAIGMWAIWLDADFHSKIDCHGGEMGTYRAALDIAKALNEQIHLGDDAGRLSETSIRQKLKTGKKSTTITYTDVVDQAMTSRGMRTTGGHSWRGWYYLERHWLLTSLMATILVIAPLCLLNSWFVEGNLEIN